MRQIFSVRFFAAVGAVVALFFVLTTIFATREVIEGDDGEADTDETVELHRIDLVEQVFSSRNENFRVEDGAAATATWLVIDGTRQLRVVRDTPGVDLCPRFGEVGACAIVADLLGEGVVWFALVPMGPGRTVELPAIDTLEDGLATLVNGWQLPFAPVLDRRCGVGDDAETFDSYREFREVMGDRFVSVYDLEERRLTAVVCRRRVPYARPSATTVPPDSSDGSIPESTSGTDDG